jgi:hypothetical protein
MDTAAYSYRNHHFYERNGYQKVSESQPVAPHLLP